MAHSRISAVLPKHSVSATPGGPKQPPAAGSEPGGSRSDYFKESGSGGWISDPGRLGTLKIGVFCQKWTKV